MKDIFRFPRQITSDPGFGPDAEFLDAEAEPETVKWTFAVKVFQTRDVTTTRDRTSEHCNARGRTPRADASSSTEMASPDIIDLTTGPNVTGVGSGVSAGEFAFDVPDDQTCLRASLEGDRKMRNGVAAAMAPAEPPADDRESNFPPLGPDDSEDSDELTENITDDDLDSASSQSVSVSDDEELDEPVAETQLEEVRPTRLNKPRRMMTPPSLAAHCGVRFAFRMGWTSVCFLRKP